jgi:hypothetical protein
MAHWPSEARGLLRAQDKASVGATRQSPSRHRVSIEANNTQRASGLFQKSIAKSGDYV